MQHLEEGMIHAWLDGALPPSEAARAEAHVAECTECAAKVAEARGFIAGSSRILTALDDVPRGVIPAAPRRPRTNRSFLQAAAVLVVVATGSLLVIRSRPAGNAQRVAVAEAPKNVAPFAEQVAARAPITAARSSAGARPNAAPVTQRRVSGIVSGTAIASGDKAFAPAVVAPPPAAVVATVVSAPLVVAAAPTTIESRQARSHDTTVNIVLSRDRLQLQAAVTTGVATAVQAPLKVLKTERTASGTRTIYEVAPDRIVTLVEYDSTNARSPIGTVAGDATISARGAATMRALDVPRVVSASSTPAAIPTSAATTPAKPPTSTIRWTDESTGRIFVLSGPFSDSELGSIRQRIERLRFTR
jgi:anti-sigma factor RsiW